MAASASSPCRRARGLFPKRVCWHPSLLSAATGPGPATEADRSAAFAPQPLHPTVTKDWIGAGSDRLPPGQPRRPNRASRAVTPLPNCPRVNRKNAPEIAADSGVRSPNALSILVMSDARPRIAGTSPPQPFPPRHFALKCFVGAGHWPGSRRRGSVAASRERIGHRGDLHGGQQPGPRG